MRDLIDLVKEVSDPFAHLKDDTVWQKGDFSISVYQGMAAYLWSDNEHGNIGLLHTRGEDPPGWLRIENVMIEPGFQGEGLGLQLYRCLLENLVAGAEGLSSRLADRHNKLQVPRIYAKLGGYVEGGWAYLPRR